MRYVIPVLSLIALVGGGACHHVVDDVARHSSSMALSADGTLYVANADADSVSVIDTTTRQLKQEILLTGAHPAVDAAGRYTPSVSPRHVALSPTMNRLFVTGERSGTLYSIDLKSNTVTGKVEVGSEPAGVLIAIDDSKVYVACSNDSKVVGVDPVKMKVVATANTDAKPWALAWSADNSTLFVTQLLGPGITTLDPANLNIKAKWVVKDGEPRADPRLYYGQVRGLYDVVVRPGSKEIWTTHLLLANKTAQPTLNFETTVFPAISILGEDGKFEARLSTNAQNIAGLNGEFGDIVSGPRAFEFTADGKYLLLVDTGSEDILAINATKRVEATLLRPLPGHQPEGIVLSRDGKHAFVDERNTGDIAVVAIDTSGPNIAMTVEGTQISRYQVDPMPAQMRLGQHMFFSANSDELPLTQNHWVSCASCHIEGRSDGVTWQFSEGPRDTPSNAGGTLDTGFLLHTSMRRTIQDYWHIIKTEQGGDFSPNNATQKAQLDALEAFVDHAMPIPIPPHTDSAKVARGQAAFLKAGCAKCHYGPALTDSGKDNPTLDLTGHIELHDVGTCNVGAFPDVAHVDDDGHAREACQFDTPALRGMADSAPYFHDGSAATLRDVLENTRGKMGDITVLSADEEDALIEYLRSL